MKIHPASEIRRPGTLLVAAGLFAGLLVAYVAVLPRDVLPGDSGELVAASQTLSIAHPPGYPLYVMGGRIFAAVFRLGSVAYRYNLLSAVVASATASLLFLLIRSLGVGTLLALGVTAATATLEAFYLQATTAEVYAVNAVATVLLLEVAVLGRTRGEKAWVLLALVGGLALSHHLSLIYPFAVACVVLGAGRPWPRPTTLALALGTLVLGLSAWLYTPVRAGTGPPLVWGETGTLSGFLGHVTAQGYRWRLRTFDLVPRLGDLADFFRVLSRESGMPLALLALVGLAASLKRPVIAGCLAGLVVLYGVHYAAYNIPDIESHIFPALIGVATLAALGLERLVRLGGGRKATARAVAALTLVLAAINVAKFEPRRDQWLAGDYVAAIEASAREACGDDCVILTTGDLSGFPMLYAAYTRAGSPEVLDLVMSNPSRVGASMRARTIEEFARLAAAHFGKENLALLGPTPRYLLGEPTRICGMVYTIGERSAGCRPPEEYPVRGVGADVRDYASRLLSGGYYLHLARWSVQERDSARAAGYIERARASAADDVVVHIEAARLYVEIGRPEQALDAARTAITVDPDFFEAHDVLANLLFMMGRYGEALAEYERALVGNPNPAPLYSNLGNAKATLGDLAGALASFQHALGLDSTLVNAHLGMGRVFEARNQVDQALLWFRRARRAEPSSAVAHHAEASLLLESGRGPEAIAVVEAGLAVRPGDAWLMADKGLYLLRQDQLDSAVFYLKEALERDASMLAVRGNLAVAYDRKGLTREAAREYARYLRAAPPGPMRERARNALEGLGGDPGAD